jgi:hypothetical protein
MKRIGVLLALIGLLSLIFATECFAQRGIRWKGSGGWGPGSQYSKMYDTTTVQSIQGVVLRVDSITPMKGMSYGVHLMVATDKDTLSVHLGPGWYIENQDTKIELKDTVEVKGSKITFQGKPAFIAAEVRKGNDVMKLRDEKGVPVWSGWRRR